MPLIDPVKTICDRLAPLGWRDLLFAVSGGQLDIAAPDSGELRKRLVKDLDAGQFKLAHPGFQDFSRQGRRGITAGQPGRSLLFHALASPGVQTGTQGQTLGGFPTLLEMETVENYVFGVEPPTVAALLARTGATKLAVVVFAHEYRPAKDTCSRLEAGPTFARTGIARVGTAPSLYHPARRGFRSEVAENAFSFRVVPSRFAAYLAVAAPGDPVRFLPMRPQDGDAARKFWVPVHKLFDGVECLAGLDLKLVWTARHVNEKLRRVRLSLKQTAPTTPPFRFSAGIAELGAAAEFGHALVVPVPHARLVEPALGADGKVQTYTVPKNNQNGFAAYEPATESDAFGEIRPAPAYVHARTEVVGAQTVDLNDDPQRPDVRATVRKGGYQAAHYLDFTGEGQVAVACAALVGKAGIEAGVHPAYSLVCAPDFFPLAGQRELSEWTESNVVPVSLISEIWGVPPNPLCDVRLPANLQLPGMSFAAKETTVAALVPLHGSTPGAVGEPRSIDAARHSCLPDDAAGVFAPGWDVSHDVVKKGGKSVPHFAAYGLGSPFPEDAKLCAALSTFWPTVAPDVTRSFDSGAGNSDLAGTVAPLTDEELGQIGQTPWDGIPGPKLVTINGQQAIECESFLHADYVRTALENRFSLRLTAQITAADYQNRVLALAFAYAALGEPRIAWFVFSFRAISSSDPEFIQAQGDAGVGLQAPIYRIELFRRSTNPARVSPNDFRRRLLPVGDHRFIFASSLTRQILHRRKTQLKFTVLPVNV